MAFIKNEIGNWDLKSFGNDPEELLKAYSNAANAAISTAVEMASGRVPGLGGQALSQGEKLLDLGNRIATGQSSQTPTMAGMDAAQLHERAVKKLRDVTELAKKRETAVSAELETARKAKATPRRMSAA
jgi:hypothetical protein